MGLGFSLLTLGLAGLFLPLLQGILFIALAVVMLSHDLPPLARAVDRLERRFPRLKKLHDRHRHAHPPDEAP